MRFSARPPVGWLTRGIMLLGGVGLALRFGLPLPATSAGETGWAAAHPDSQESGRGRAATPAAADAVRAGHEMADMSGRLMGRLVALLFAVALTVIAGMVGLRMLVLSVRQAAQPATTALQREPVRAPAPNLQVDPLAEIAALRSAEAVLLDHYAWVDSSHTTARIPIGRAKALIIGHPLETAP